MTFLIIKLIGKIMLSIPSVILAIYSEIYYRNMGLSQTQKVFKSRIIKLRYVIIICLSRT